MKIIHFFRSPVGGIFRHVRDLLAEQSSAGHEVGIICDANTGGEYEDKLFAQIEPSLKLGLHRIPMTRSISLVDLITLAKAYRLINSIRPDVVHTHSAKAGIHGRIAAKLVHSSSHPVKSFYCPHGGAMHYGSGSLKGRVFFTAERFMERFCDSLIFVSDYERNAYHEKVGVPACPEAIVYNSLTEEEFEPIVLAEKPADFLYIGMMRDLKGPDVFLNALHILHTRNGNDVSGVFVGDGPDKVKYQEQIVRLGLGNAVEVYAAMPAREAFAKAKVVVVPSRAESMPYLVLEAIAAHMPIVATDVGGIPEIFTDKSDRLVLPDDAKALSEEMQRVLKSSDRRVTAEQFAEDLKNGFHCG